MKLIRASAPLRISFAGGGTDVSPYTEDHGGAVLSATIDKHAYASLTPRSDDRFQIYDADSRSVVTGTVGCELPYNGTQDLAKSVIKRLGVRLGFDLRLHADATWGTGLGSSSTHIVAVMGAFAHWGGMSMSAYEIAEMAYTLERIDIGQAGGHQDQYSAVFGGFNFIEFDKSGATVHPLRVHPDVICELHYRLLLCSLGRTRRSAQILEDQVARYKQGEADSVSALHRTKELAYEMKRALLRGRIGLMGELLHEAWEQKRRFSALISNPYIDEIYEDARKHGAIGGKVLGAGGGGHMLFLCPEEGKRELADHLSSRGLDCVAFAFDPNGLTVWEYSNGNVGGLDLEEQRHSAAAGQR